MSSKDSNHLVKINDPTVPLVARRSAVFASGLGWRLGVVAMSLALCALAYGSLLATRRSREPLPDPASR